MQLDDGHTLEPDQAATSDTEAPAAGPRLLEGADKLAISSTYNTLKANVPGFRTRRAQAHMVGACARALGNEGGAAIVEAGTGTGKSLAYLTAGAALATLHDLKLVIATGTVTLQEQLANRDIPMFLKATRIDARTSIAKGRGRYACPRNMEMLASSGDQSSLLFGVDDDLADAAAWPRQPLKGEPEAVQQLASAWGDGSWDGDLDNTPLPLSEKLRPLLTTTSGGCTLRKCFHYYRCPYVKAREQMEKAQIIVTNHALLVSDLQFPGEDESFGGVVLPPLKECLLVVDEGHQLSQTAIQATAASSYPAGIIKRMQKWLGITRAAYRALGKENIGQRSITEGHELLTQLSSGLTLLNQSITRSWIPDPKDGDYAIYRAPLGQVPESWRLQAVELNQLAQDALRWLKSIKRLLNEHSDSLDAGSKAVLPREIGLISEQVSELAQVLCHWASEVADSRFPPVAKWVRMAGTAERSPVLCASPVIAASFIRERIFEQAAGVVVTSATITAGGDFTKTSADLGFPRSGETLALTSPFDYQNQGVLQVPWMESAANDLEAHSKEIAAWLESNVDRSAGTLVLFTSKVKLKRVFDLLPADLQSVTLQQGQVSKAELLQRHSTRITGGSGSMLFGLHSLGEGIDLVGDLCTTLVVTAIPFQTPTDPIGATYAEWLESRGRRPFDEIAIPSAIRLLTQYVGRLIRHETDEGRVVILDRRIVDKSYGKRILNALPCFRREIERRPA